MEIYNKDKILKEAVERCISEMYYFSQPSVSNIEEAVKEEGDDEKNPFYTKHYLSQKDYTTIINKYVEMYNLKDSFAEYCNLLIDNMTNGCTSSIKGDDGFHIPMPKLLETIGEENAQKCIDFINDRKSFYKFGRQESSFRFTVMNVAPTSAKDKVIEYWKSKGITIEIIDRNPDYNYERFYLGYSEEEINELIKEEENELAE